MEYKYNNFTKTLIVYHKSGKTEKIIGQKAVNLYKQLTEYEQ